MDHENQEPHDMDKDNDCQKCTVPAENKERPQPQAEVDENILTNPQSLEQLVSTNLESDLPYTIPLSSEERSSDNSNSYSLSATTLEQYTTNHISNAVSLQSNDDSQRKLNCPLCTLKKRPVMEDPYSYCPICQLDSELTKRPLCDKDEKLARSILAELAENAESLPSLSIAVSEIVNFNRRLVLFDGDGLEIRVHLFASGATEGFIHNHQWNFISYCLQGSYWHKLHSIVDSSEKYLLIKRKTGGDYSEEQEERLGTPTNILAQPFQAGQRLFISAHAYHTVEPLSSQNVVTVVFRDKKNRVHEFATIIQTTLGVSSFQPEKVQLIMDPRKIKNIQDEFVKVLSEFKKEFYDKNIGTITVEAA